MHFSQESYGSKGQKPSLSSPTTDRSLPRSIGGGGSDHGQDSSRLTWAQPVIPGESRPYPALHPFAKPQGQILIGYTSAMCCLLTNLSGHWLGWQPLLGHMLTPAARGQAPPKTQWVGKGQEEWRWRWIWKKSRSVPGRKTQHRSINHPLKLWWELKDPLHVTYFSPWFMYSINADSQYHHCPSQEKARRLPLPATTE